jgi:hypothetical protein
MICGFRMALEDVRRNGWIPFLPVHVVHWWGQQKKLEERSRLAFMTHRSPRTPARVAGSPAPKTTHYQQPVVSQ